jgi:CBS domain-containing protein
MKVKDAMTSGVLTVSPDDSLYSVIEFFLSKQISGAPVVKDGRIVGVISQSDVLKKTGLSDLIKLKVSDEKLEIIKNLKVSQVMNKEIFSVREEDDVGMAVKLMNEKDVNRLPVVNLHGSLVGILTRGDVLRVFSKSLGSWTLLERKEPIILETDIDKLLKIIEEKDAIAIDALAATLKVGEDKVEGWGRTLEEHGLVKMEYPPFGKPRLKAVK